MTRNNLVPAGSAEEARFWERVDDRLGPAGQDVAAYFLCTPGGRPIPVRGGDVAKALVDWRALPAGEPKAEGVHRGGLEPAELEPEVLRPPSGGIIFEVSQRVLERDDQGRIRTPGKMMTSNGGIPIPAQPNGDFLWLTAAEWKSLVPLSPRPGTRLAVPVPVRDRILRFHLGNGAKRLTEPWGREEIRSGELTLTVEDASPERVRLRLDGSAVLMSAADPIRAERGYQPRLVGLLEYDPRQGRFRRFDFAAVGECWGVELSSNPELCGPYRYTLGVAFELVGGQDPGERRPPFCLWRGKNTRRHREEYFGG